jgi:hypothetical protein
VTSIARISLIVCLLSGTGCRGEAADAPPSASSATTAAARSMSASPSLPEPPPERARSSFERGLRASYTVQLESEATMQGSPLTQFSLNGALELWAIDVSAERIVLRGKLLSPKLTTALPGKAEEFRSLEPALMEAFAFELLPGNVLGQVWVPPARSGLVAGIQKVLASAVQGGDRGEPAFVVVEQDTVGAYRAHYQRDSARGSFEKRKLAYGRSAPALGGPASQLPQIEESRGRIRFDENARLVSSSATERIVAVGMTGSVVSRSSVSLERTAVSVVAERPDPAALLAALRPFDELTLPSKAPERTDAARIAGRSLPQVLASLRAQGEPPTDPAAQEAFANQRADLFGALQGLIREQPSVAAQLSALVASDDALSPVLLDALSASGAPTAQRAMLALLPNKHLAAKPRRMLIISLSRAQKPTRETTDALVRLLSDSSSRTQAMYGLGTCIRRLRSDGEARRARQLLDVVLAKLDQADSTVARVTALRALANAGDELAFPKVEPLLGSEDEEVRAAAVESLQLVNLPQAVTALADALTKDPSREVRLAATRAMFAHEPSAPLVLATRTVAQKDQNAHVRLSAVRALGAWLTARPELRDVLTGIAETDSEQQIRDVAQSALNGTQPSPALAN